MRERPPRWARIAIAVLGAICLVFLVVTSALSEEIGTYLSERIGIGGVIVGGLALFGLFIWIAARLDD